MVARNRLLQSEYLGKIQELFDSKIRFCSNYRLFFCQAEIQRIQFLAKL